MIWKFELLECKNNDDCCYECQHNVEMVMFIIVKNKKDDYHRKYVDVFLPKRLKKKNDKEKYEKYNTEKLQVTVIIITITNNNCADDMQTNADFEYSSISKKK